MDSQNHQIALLIDTATSWGRGLIEGIVDFAQAQTRNWIFSFEPRGKYDPMMLPTGWDGDGVIARITHSALAEQLTSERIPAVNVSWYPFADGLIPRCTCDEQAAAKMAAQYFIDLGCRQFAYCGSTLRPNYQDRFGSAFRQTLADARYQCPCFAPDHTQFSQLNAQQRMQELSKWLSQLPRPTGLLTFDDLQGRQVTEACALAGISVPHDIAVLGGEHDTLCSRISRPALSGVDQAPQEVGYHAAEMLDRIIQGETLETMCQLIPPRRVISRQSTDTVAIEDELLSMTVRYIRDHCTDRFQVDDLLREVPISRRAMEIGFRKYLGRSPTDEIRRVRVERAVQLLCDTDWSIMRISSACGFDRPELLTRAFRRELRTTPSEFRKRVLAVDDETD